MKLFLTLLDGFRLSVDSYVTPRRYPVSGGFASDAVRLYGDVRVVGKDVKKAVVKAETKMKGRGDGKARTVASALQER
ncbi:hypothetical protein F7Q92_06390 [Ideonella dechloratans]|uniref:Uncharacterized protein n=1 Tax=Ideonella dechloratans TaxID=36863 RepID=A0A643FFA3_IDEDE|nr:hypothetical protein [Ideonella dechloratans]KAB0583695.1 hypothetical protein F7Q92_06390 [Ideonella dechloratans]